MSPRQNIPIVEKPKRQRQTGVSWPVGPLVRNSWALALKASFPISFKGWSGCHSGEESSDVFEHGPAAMGCPRDRLLPETPEPSVMLAPVVTKRKKNKGKRVTPTRKFLRKQ